jgi:hypothetical protein
VYVLKTTAFILLLLAEIVLWIYLPFLLGDAVVEPPHRWFNRVQDMRVRPPVVISESPHPGYEPFNALRWLEFPPPWGPGYWSLQFWRERGGRGMGPLEGYHVIIGRPDIPWAIARIVTTAAAGALAICVLHALRGRLRTRARGFEVTYPPAPARRDDVTT